MKQASKIYRNKLIKYLKLLKYNCTFLSLFLNSLSLMNSLSSTNFINSMNSLNSAIIMLKICHQDVELIWQMIKVKKRWINFFLCMTSDLNEMTSEQTQKCSIRKCEKFSMIESIQRVFSVQSQQQLQITLWWNNSFYEFYNITSENHWRFKNYSWLIKKFTNST